MPIPELLFNVLYRSMAESCDFFLLARTEDSQHPYAGCGEVQNYLPGNSSTSAFCLGSQDVGIATSGCGGTKVHGCGRQDAVVIQFLFGVIDNSDY